MEYKLENAKADGLETARTIMAKCLRDWRMTRRIPLKQVADEFGVAQTTWNRWEKGSRFPSPENMAALSKYIGVPICRFFYPEDTNCPQCSHRQRVPGSSGNAEISANR